jgi:hypothetical protein
MRKLRGKLLGDSAEYLGLVGPGGYGNGFEAEVQTARVLVQVSKLGKRLAFSFPLGFRNCRCIRSAGILPVGFSIRR